MSDAGDDTSDMDMEAGGQPGSRYTTAGNDADVEDNDLPPFTPVLADPEAIRERLRRSPPEECLPTTPCKLLHEREDTRMHHRLLSAQDRLTTRPKSAVEMVSDTIQKPKGAVPSLALPYWHSLPLDKKIPLLPAPTGFMYYSRGKVCEKLNRQSKVYSLNDPYNRERTVRCTYNAVNDPHAKSFMNRPTTRKALYRQGFINRSNEIIVPLSEFNSYRNYLRTLHADEVNQSFRNTDEFFKKEREQVRLINQYLHSVDEKTTDRKRKTAESIRRIGLAAHYRTAGLMRKQDQTSARVQMWAKERERIYTERALISTQKERLFEEKLRILHKGRQMDTRKKMQQSIMKVMRSTEKKMQDSEMTKKVQETYRMEWINTKINESQARFEKEQNIARSWKETLKSRAKARQRRMEALRADLPNMIERKKKEEARIMANVRKYFYRWLEKVRKRRRSIDDDTSVHTSVWIKGASGTLDQTVSYLRFQTDTHEKLDDFIFSIMRLKSAIKRQIALEGSDEDDSEDYLKPNTEADSAMPAPSVANMSTITFKQA